MELNLTNDLKKGTVLTLKKNITTSPDSYCLPLFCGAIKKIYQEDREWVITKVTEAENLKLKLYTLSPKTISPDYQAGFVTDEMILRSLFEIKKQWTNWEKSSTSLSKDIDIFFKTNYRVTYVKIVDKKYNLSFKGKATCHKLDEPNFDLQQGYKIAYERAKKKYDFFLKNASLLMEQVQSFGDKKEENNAIKEKEVYFNITDSISIRIVPTSIYVQPCYYKVLGEIKNYDCKRLEPFGLGKLFYIEDRVKEYNDFLEESASYNDFVTYLLGKKDKQTEINFKIFDNVLVFFNEEKEVHFDMDLFCEELLRKSIEENIHYLAIDKEFFKIKSKKTTEENLNDFKKGIKLAANKLHTKHELTIRVCKR